VGNAAYGAWYRLLCPRRRIADSARDVDDLVVAVGGLIA
jgi:hypothetical protein